MLELPVLQLFENPCPTCPLLAACGGEPNARCGCLFEGKEARRVCTDCPRLCVERQDARTGFRSASEVAEHILPLNEVDLGDSHRDVPVLPPFIVRETRNLRSPVVVPVAAVSLADLFRLQAPRRGEPIDDPIRARARLRLPQDCSLIALLHGADEMLERFWGGDRPEFLAWLREIGVTMVTGPTFSVVGDRSERSQFENVANLGRHHRVLPEIRAADLIAVPNLYTSNAFDRDATARWLAQQTGVRVVSRDFSRTKGNAVFACELAELTSLLEASGRSLHVLVVGVGLRKAHLASAALRSVGASASFVTGDPITLAVRGGDGLAIGADGRPTRLPSKAKKERLAHRNISFAARFFSTLQLKVVPRDQSSRTIRTLHRLPLGA